MSRGGNHWLQLVNFDLNSCLILQLQPKSYQSNFTYWSKMSETSTKVDDIAHPRSSLIQPTLQNIGHKARDNAGFRHLNMQDHLSFCSVSISKWNLFLIMLKFILTSWIILMQVSGWSTVLCLYPIYYWKQVKQHPQLGGCVLLYPQPCQNNYG